MSTHFSQVVNPCGAHGDHPSELQFFPAVEMHMQRSGIFHILYVYVYYIGVFQYGLGEGGFRSERADVSEL